jgi:PAS domain S-box-containing protein
MRSEERHRTLIEETPLGIAVFREEGDCVLLNDAICRILTSRRESILGKNFHTLSSWTDCGLLEAAEEAFSRWTQVSLNTTTTVMSGKTLHISCILSPYRVRNEKFLMVIVEDRTVQKNAEIALGHARAWKDALLENSPVGIAVLDNERRIQDLNPTTATIFGYCYEEAIGREVSFLHLSPDQAKRFGESVYPAIRRGEPVRREWQLQRKEGEVFWADLSGKAINPIDLDQGVIWIIIDISARKAAEEMLRQAAAWREALLTNSPVGIFVVDHERKIIDINPAAFEIFGFDNNELLGSSSRALYYSDEMWESFGSQVYPYIARGETKRLEFQFKRKDGEPCWCDATGRALQPGNLNAGVIWIVQDISERKKVERELERYRRDLVLANEELDNKVKARTREIERLLAQKDRFIIQLGHDLRTPLTPILALLPLLKRDLSDPRQVELVEVILGSARQLKELMERVLTLAKLNSGAFRYILKDVEIRDEVLRTIGLHLHQIQEKDLVVTQSIETNMMTKADQEFFHSIIENLISNAIKYTPFSGEIGVTVTRMGDQGRSW